LFASLAFVILAAALFCLCLVDGMNTNVGGPGLLASKIVVFIQKK
jgi:hypothetical protein